METTLLLIFIVGGILGLIARFLPKRHGYFFAVARSILPTIGWILAGGAGLVWFIVSVSNETARLFPDFFIFIGSLVLLALGVILVAQGIREYFGDD